MVYLDREGLFAPINTPVTDDIPEQGVHETWAWTYIDLFTPAWNTDLISPAEDPKTWEDVLTKYEGQMLMEIGDVDWFATIVKGYFMEKRGMTEEEALDLFREAARGATF